MKESINKEERDDLKILIELFELPPNAIEIISQLKKLRRTTDEIKQSLIQMNDEFKK